jgi:uncharacterized membrane protein (Fun14 family)
MGRIGRLQFYLFVLDRYARGHVGALSYFHIMNVDLTSVQQRYSGDVSWLGDQASRLKDVAIAYLPVHAGSLFGVFLGFRRGRV